jgi:hypothetical protein
MYVQLFLVRTDIEGANKTQLCDQNFVLSRGNSLVPCTIAIVASTYGPEYCDNVIFKILSTVSKGVTVRANTRDNSGSQ